MKTDFLVIGSGLAGLVYAIKTATRFPEKTITILAKDSGEESNSKMAQGGIAIVQSNHDSVEKHIEDTLVAGDGLCDSQIVKMVVESAQDCLDYFVEMGVNFDRKPDGTLDMGKEGGHSENRVLHYKDITGKEIIRSLVSKARELKNIQFYKNLFAVDFIMSAKNNSCIGAIVLDEKEGIQTSISSKITILATGGLGQIYKQTTNPKVATGDGIAMANRVGAKVSDMEFIQFHPTAFYSENGEGTFLITEAIRGAGAVLRNEKGEAFMGKYDSRKDLASRDIVSRAIVNEIQGSEIDYVYLDCREVKPELIEKHFPNIQAQCKAQGLDILKEMIPVSPAAHYVCGGVEVDENGCTTLAQLLACGECSRTGLHGANRLASNSLLEAYVFADKCFEKSSKLIADIEFEEINQKEIELEEKKDSKSFLLEQKLMLQQIMTDKVGIIRSNLSLKESERLIKAIGLAFSLRYENKILSEKENEFKNMLEVALLVVLQSQNQTKNKGGYFNLDFVN